MNKKIILFFSVLLFQACSSHTSLRKSTFDGSLERSIASEKFIDKIPFPSGAIDPKTYIASEVEYKKMEEIARIDGLERDMKKEDCGERESGFWMICSIHDSEVALGYMDDNGPLKKLHPVELAALNWYADRDYVAFNEALRTMDPEKLKLHELKIKLAISGLNKGFKHLGRSVRCDNSQVEGEQKTQAVADRYSVGEVFQTRSFLSTSLGENPQFIETWLKSCGVLLNIYQRGGGVLIEEIASYIDEQEVLVKPLTKFKVLKKNKTTKNGKLFYIIDLEEVN